jgi:HEAT repeat protein
MKEKKYCELQIVHCKLQIGTAAVVAICNLQFAICNLQFSFADEPATSSAGVAAPGDEARYDGRSLSEWRERFQNLNFDDPQIAEEVPGLLAIVEDTEAPWFTRRQAAITLGRIGEPAEEAVPVLIGLLDEPMTDPEQSTQLWALKALALFGPLAADAAPHVVEMLEDESRDELARLTCIETLGRIGPQQPDVLPALIRTIEVSLKPGSAAQHSAALERSIAAAEMLELFGGNASPAVPVLIRATRSESVLLRRAASNTLGLVGPAADPAIPPLVDLVLFDESNEVRDLAGRALGRIGDTAEAPLVQLLADSDVDVRRRAALAFAEMQSITPETELVLRETALAEEPPVAVAALLAVWRTTADEEFVTAGGLKWLTDPDREVRMRAVELLESLGQAAESAVPKLTELADDERPYVRQAARRVLRSVSAVPAS